VMAGVAAATAAEAAAGAARTSLERCWRGG
jgi:hypothetical protein